MDASAPILHPERALPADILEIYMYKAFVKTTQDITQTHDGAELLMVFQASSMQSA